MGIFFLTWDHYFTKWGVWSFNPEYVTGIYLAGMPVEEWMFFLFIPYSCLFIYHCLNLFLGHRQWERIAPVISGAVVIICTGLMIAGVNRFYTFSTAFFLAVFILLMMIYRHSYWMGRFYRAYLVSKIPFLLVNGLLTALPVVMYNDNENLGTRIYTIPVEDVFYSMLMLMMVTAVYERLKKRSLKRETA
jgi:lycopene cyclase domain-containing protein